MVLCRCVFFYLFFLLFPVGVYANEMVDCGKVPCADGAPSFSVYPVKDIYKGSSVAIKFAGNKKARQYRTLLRDDKNKADFAGHYKLVSWGCGTECLQAAIVDVRSGAVYFPKELSAVVYSSVVREEPMPAVMQYTINSSLLYLLCYVDGKSGVYGFNWNGNKLIPVFRQWRIWGGD